MAVTVKSSDTFLGMRRPPYYSSLFTRKFYQRTNQTRYISQVIKHVVFPLARLLAILGRSIGPVSESHIKQAKKMSESLRISFIKLLFQAWTVPKLGGTPKRG